MVVAGVVGMLTNVRVLLLHTNHISRVDNIGSLVNLEVLSLSTNKIDMLPDARVFACLRRLVVSPKAMYLPNYIVSDCSTPPSPFPAKLRCWTVTRTA